MAALTPPKALPHGKNDALPNVVMSFDVDKIKQFHDGLLVGTMNTDIEGLFPLVPKSHLLEFEMQMGEHGDSTRSGFEYNLVLSEVNDEFQVRLLEHFAHTKKFGGGLSTSHPEHGGIEKLASLYMAWGWGRDAKTWSSVHRGLINNINYEFNAFNDKILRIQMFDDISFFLDLPAAAESRLEVEDKYYGDQTIAWNISNIISKFLAGVFYDSFVIVDLDENAVRAFEDSAEKHSNAAYSMDYNPSHYINNRIVIGGTYDPTLVVEDTQSTNELAFWESMQNQNGGKSPQELLEERADLLDQIAEDNREQASEEKLRRETHSANWNGASVQLSVDHEKRLNDDAASAERDAAELRIIDKKMGSTVQPQSTSEVYRSLS